MPERQKPSSWKGALQFLSCGAIELSTTSKNKIPGLSPGMGLKSGPRAINSELRVPVGQSETLQELDYMLSYY